jgi:uncharacterized pyridoxal phosphate-containing UPF0001 family protein
MIATTLEQLKERIATRCATVGRSPSEIVLLAVSKTFAPADVSEVVHHGVADIGENYA